MGEFKFLVTGSRDWRRGQVIAKALHTLHHKIGSRQGILIHGACPTGADAMAEDVWERIIDDGPYLGMRSIDRYPADWDRLGKRAGFVRNELMIDQGPSLVLAFWRNRSKGTHHTMNLARAHGIKLIIWRDND